MDFERNSFNKALKTLAFFEKVVINVKWEVEMQSLYGIC